jgi:hypothetical protein
MFTESDIVLNSTQNKLLFEIYKQLINLNTNIEGLREDLKPSDTNIPFSDESSLTIDFESMKRPELMKLVSELDNKPEGWAKLSNTKLIELLKEG